MTSQRRRAYLYLTRKTGQLQVAVFRHPDETLTLTVQIPGGTIEPHETPEAGARREAFEESGVDDPTEFCLVARDTWYGEHDGVTRERYFYRLNVTQALPDSWNHTVSDGELDKGLVFAYFWLSIAEARRVLGPMGDYLHLLE